MTDPSPDPHPALDGATTALRRQVEELTAELETTRIGCRDFARANQELEAEVARLREELETLRLAVEAGRLLIATERAAREKAEANYRFMVERAADEKLDGYREMAQKAADAECERDTALARVKELELWKERHKIDPAHMSAAESALASARELLELARDAIDEACYPVWWQKWRAFIDPCSGCEETAQRVMRECRELDPNFGMASELPDPAQAPSNLQGTGPVPMMLCDEDDPEDEVLP